MKGLQNIKLELFDYYFLKMLNMSMQLSCNSFGFLLFEWKYVQYTLFIGKIKIKK